MNLNSPTQRIGIVTGGACLLLVVVWYFALWSPQGHALTKANAARSTAEARVTQLHTQIAGLEALEKNIPSDQQKLGTYKAAVPDDPQLDQALDQIQTAATNSHVTLSSVSPSSAPTSSSASSLQEVNGVPILAVSMSATGTYPSVVSFLTSLNQMPRTLIITNLSLSSSGAGQSSAVTASIGSDIFYAGKPTS